MHNDQVNSIRITNAVAYSYGVKDELEHFNEDMRIWRSVMQITDPSWCLTTAVDNNWNNYYIDTNGGLNTALPLHVNCFRPRRNNNSTPIQWAGIDCSGFVQRCASNLQHSTLPSLGNRSTWTVNNAAATEHGAAYFHDFDTYAIGEYLTPKVCDKIVPGDVIIRVSIPGQEDHITLVNYVTGARGLRNHGNIMLIQAIGGNENRDNPDGQLEGQVTDTWNWGNMNNKTFYKARRLKP